MSDASVPDPAAAPPPERARGDWQAMSREDQLQVVAATISDFAEKRARGTVHPPGAIRDFSPTTEELFIEFQVHAARHIRETYDVPNALWGTEVSGDLLYELDDHDFAMTRRWRQELADAYAAAADRHAAAFEAARVAEAAANPGFRVIVGSLNPLQHTPLDQRHPVAERQPSADLMPDAAPTPPITFRAAPGLSPDAWMAEQQAAHARAHRSPAEVIREEERARQGRAAARAAEAEQRRQSRLARGWPPGGF